MVDIGEGPNFVHIITDGSEPIREVDIHQSEIASITVYEVDDDVAKPPVILGADGSPLEGDEAQSEEQLPVEQKDAGATPVVPAISDAGVV